MTDSNISAPDEPLTVAQALEATRAPEGGRDDASGEIDSASVDADAAASDGPRGDESDQAHDAADHPDGQPPINPPRSWTKDEKQAFAALPRELQQSIAERERARDVDIGRRQNEIADLARAAQAKMQAAELARRHYEEKLPLLAQSLEAQANREFADIRTWDDVQKMAREDPTRYNVWHAMRSQQEAFAAEAAEAEARHRLEQESRARAFYEEQTRLFIERAPEFAHPKQSAELRAEAVATLTELGFAPQEISHAWQTGGSIPVHDHRFQLLVRDAMRYRSAQNGLKKAAGRQAPHMQRPGSAFGPREERSERVKNLDNRLTRTGNVRDALALLKASRGSS